MIVIETLKPSPHMDRPARQFTISPDEEKIISAINKQRHSNSPINTVKPIL